MCRYCTFHFFDFGLISVSTCGFESHQGPFRSLTFPPVLRDWVIKGFGMSSLVYATGHIKDPVPLIEKRRGLSPGGRFPPSFMHQVIIITGLNKLQLYVRPEDGLRCRQGVKPPLNPITFLRKIFGYCKCRWIRNSLKICYIWKIWRHDIPLNFDSHVHMDIQLD